MNPILWQHTESGFESPVERKERTFLDKKPDPKVKIRNITLKYNDEAVVQPYTYICTFVMMNKR